MIFTLIFFSSLFVVTLYFYLRAEWVFKNLIQIIVDSKSYFHPLINDDNISFHDYKVISRKFYEEPCLQVMYWIFKKPFTYDVKKILTKEVYDKIYEKKEIK